MKFDLLANPGKLLARMPLLLAGIDKILSRIYEFYLFSNCLHLMLVNGTK